MKTRQKRRDFVLCIRNEECDDLEERKIYQVVPDKKAEREGYLRVIDESGEDYLYPETYFTSIRLSAKAKDAVAATVTS